MSDVPSDTELNAPDPIEAAPEAQPTEPEETHKGFIKLDKHQKDVNNQHAKFRYEERSRKAAEEESERLRNELAELRNTKDDLTIPDVPDQYSEDYQEQIAKRDQAIKANAEHDAELNRLADDKKRSDKAVADRIEKEDAAQVAVFDANMVALGVSPVEVKAAADKIIEYGISDGLSDFILEDPDGPLMVKYLEKNPTELEEMNKMSSLSLFNHINSTVRAKAQLLKPKTSDAPDPPLVPTGGGVPELQEDWEKGVKYE